MTPTEVFTPIFREQLRKAHGLLLSANCTGVATDAVNLQLRQAFEVVDGLLDLLEEDIFPVPGRSDPNPEPGEGDPVPEPGQGRSQP